MEQSAFEHGYEMGQSIARYSFFCCALTPGMFAVFAWMRARATKKSGWNITAVISALFTAVLLAVLALNWVNRVNGAAFEFESRHSRVSLATKFGWQEVQFEFENSIGGAYHPRTEQCAAVLVTAKDETTPTLEVLMHRVFENTAAQSEANKVRSKSALVTESDRIPRAIIDAVVDGEERMIVYYQFEREDEFIQLVCWCSHSQRKSALIIFNDIAESVQIESRPAD